MARVVRIGRVVTVSAIRTREPVAARSIGLRGLTPVRVDTSPASDVADRSPLKPALELIAEGTKPNRPTGWARKKWVSATPTENSDRKARRELAGTVKRDKYNPERVLVMEGRR